MFGDAARNGGPAWSGVPDPSHILTGDYDI